YPPPGQIRTAGRGLSSLGSGFGSSSTMRRIGAGKTDSVGVVTLVSHFVGLPSTSYGLPLTINWKNFSSPILSALSPAGLPGQTLTVNFGVAGIFWAAIGSSTILPLSSRT